MGTAPSSRIGSDPARRRFMEERQRGVYDFVGGLTSVLFISVRNNAQTAQEGRFELIRCLSSIPGG